MASHNGTDDNRLRSRRWFDDPADPAMTALYLERYMNYGITPEELRRRNFLHTGDETATVPGAKPAIAGASPEADPIDPGAGSRWYLVGPAILAAAVTVFFGVIPQPLVEFATHAGASLF